MSDYIYHNTACGSFYFHKNHKPSDDQSSTEDLEIIKVRCHYHSSFEESIVRVTLSICRALFRFYRVGFDFDFELKSIDEYYQNFDDYRSFASDDDIDTFKVYMGHNGLTGNYLTRSDGFKVGIYIFGGNFVMNPFLLAHELFHILIENQHFPNTDNLMFEGEMRTNNRLNLSQILNSSGYTCNDESYLDQFAYTEDLIREFVDNIYFNNENFPDNEYSSFQLGIMYIQIISAVI